MASLNQRSLDQYQQLYRYYHSLESIFGYRLILADRRHYGYYDYGIHSPFPIYRALHEMEDRLLSSLNVKPGANVLDAGCGFGHVAIHAAEGPLQLQVQCIDIMDYHISQAERNVKTHGLLEKVKVRKMDYHNLGYFSGESFDGVYQMESLAHAYNPESALSEYFRVLRPGGSLAIHDFEWKNPEELPLQVRHAREMINKYASMSAEFRVGSIQALLEKAGFRDIVVEDFSTNIRPMLRLFFILAYVPYLVIQLFKLQFLFTNIMVGTEAYLTRNYWRYVSISARKPETASVE